MQCSRARSYRGRLFGIAAAQYSFQRPYRFASSGGPVADEAGEIPRAPADDSRRNRGRSGHNGVEVHVPLLRPAGAENRVRINGVFHLRAGADVAPWRDASAVEVEPEPGAILLCLASTDFESADYIHDVEFFRKQRPV